jgi:negative regulator of flagellin synthesis FlgM
LAAFSVDAGHSVHAGTPRDHVEISPLGQMLDGIDRLPEIRHEKVAEIRRQIEAGTYETPDKLERALDNLLNELHGW